MRLHMYVKEDLQSAKAVASRMIPEYSRILSEFSGDRNPSIEVREEDELSYYRDYSEYSTKGDTIRTVMPGTALIHGLAALSRTPSRSEEDAFLENVGKALSSIKGVRASTQAISYENGKAYLQTNLILPKIKGASDPDAIPADISLPEFSRKYVGAEGKNKTTRTPADISGVCTLEDGTECVAYFSHGNGFGKKRLVTSLKNFISHFTAPATGSDPGGRAPDTSNYDGKYRGNRTPVPAYVVGSFVNSDGEGCLVLFSEGSPQPYSWVLQSDFDRRYTPMTESAARKESVNRIRLVRKTSRA